MTSKLGSELKPCPFCGGEPSWDGEYDRRGYTRIFCRADDCFGPQTTAGTFEDSAAQWNKRADLPPVAQTGPTSLSDAQIMKAIRSLRLTEKTITPCTKSWKDGIDIDEPSWTMTNLVKALLEQLPAASPPTGDDCSCGGGDISGHDALCPERSQEATNAPPRPSASHDDVRRIWVHASSRSDFIRSLFEEFDICPKASANSQEATDQIKRGKS